MNQTEVENKRELGSGAMSAIERLTAEILYILCRNQQEDFLRQALTRLIILERLKK